MIRVGEPVQPLELDDELETLDELLDAPPVPLEELALDDAAEDELLEELVLDGAPEDELLDAPPVPLEELALDDVLAPDDELPEEDAGEPEEELEELVAWGAPPEPAGPVSDDEDEAPAAPPVPVP